MLRDKNLIPLSHQHQHALALCVRIERASPVAVADLGAWQEEIAQIVRSEIRVHFAAEERVLFPVAGRFEELTGLVKELLVDHKKLREDFACAERRGMSAEQLSGFARRLSAHIRKEERRLFERIQQAMNAAELADLGARLDDALKDASQSCAVPNEVTKLRATR
ncbi:MAG: hemerythrin domain-containing protein [Candidatus Sulfotelmatobacter sp.]